MLTKLASLNRITDAIVRLIGKNTGVDISLVINYCKEVAIAGWPEHADAIKFGHRLGLFEVDREEIRLSSSGQRFWTLNGENTYDLTDNQKKYLFRYCYLDGILRPEAQVFFQLFGQDYDRSRFFWSEVDGAPIDNFDWLQMHFSELGVLRRTTEGLEVLPAYTETVAIFLQEGSGWSEAEFRKYLKEKEEIGTIGEEIVLQREENRLAEMGFHAEAVSVRRISGLRVNAGYDIESYDGKSKGMKFDRFIEVKASRSNRVRFFWTRNEIEIAKKLGDRYWIYYVPRINSRTRTCDAELVRIQDPINRLRDTILSTVPQGLIVEGPIDCWKTIDVKKKRRKKQ